MVNVRDILYSICENDLVYTPNIDLLESGILDSFSFIELFYKLEENGININPARIKREDFRTIEKLQELVNKYIEREDL